VSTDSIDSDLLNAYVDGELDAADSARVAEAIARDPAVAREVMLLSRLKSATAEAIGEEAIDLPSGRFSRPRLYRIAASLVLGLVGAAALWFSMSGSPPGSSSTDFARRGHSSWTTVARDKAVDPSVVLAAAPAQLVHAYVPDLSAAKLSLVHAAIVDSELGTTLVVGYAGTRGCRVTLLVTAAGDDSDKLFRIGEVTELASAQWRAGDLNYMLLAKGMARKRFRLLATSVYDASLEAVPISEDDRMALARSRAQSKPCLSA
jgi:anti-sigma factor RsiW